MSKVEYSEILSFCCCNVIFCRTWKVSNMIHCCSLSFLSVESEIYLNNMRCSCSNILWRKRKHLYIILLLRRMLCWNWNITTKCTLLLCCDLCSLEMRYTDTMYVFSVIRVSILSTWNKLWYYTFSCFAILIYVES